MFFHDLHASRLIVPVHSLYAYCSERVAHLLHIPTRLFVSLISGMRPRSVQRAQLLNFDRKSFFRALSYVFVPTRTLSYLLVHSIFLRFSSIFTFCSAQNHFVVSCTFLPCIQFPRGFTKKRTFYRQRAFSYISESFTRNQNYDKFRTLARLCTTCIDRTLILLTIPSPPLSSFNKHLFILFIIIILWSLPP